MKINKALKKIIEKAESLGWTVTIEEQTKDGITFDFAQGSPAGQDYHFSAEARDNDADNLIRSIESVHDYFDVSEAAYIWLDSSGHGTNGAPYDMKDVYEDMAACRDMVYALWDAL